MLRMSIFWCVFCIVCASAVNFAAEPTTRPGEWYSLFDGKSLGKWKVTDFGGQGEVKVQNKSIIMPIGNDMSGVTYSGKDIPTMNYEIELEASRVDGNDFFCGLTFPVNKSSASLILGGWGGSVCGISSLDGYDAANNNTTTTRQFTKGQWYHVRVRVTENRIQAWLDREKLVDVDTTDKKIDVRLEVELSKPLGIATWQTAGAARNIRTRTLYADEIEASKQKPEN